MRIVHVVECFAGGVFQYLVDLTNSPFTYNDEIYILYVHKSETPADFPKCFGKNVKFIELKHMSRKLSFSTIHKATKELKVIIEEINPDIIQLHSSIAGFVGRRLDSNKYRIFYTPHGYAFLNSHSRFKKLMYYMAEKVAGKNKSITIACSSSEYSYAKKLSRSQVLVKNSIDLDHVMKFKCESKNSLSTIVTSGRIGYQKNPELFNFIAKQNPNMQFIWIGDGEDKYILDSSNIKITGWKSRDEVLSIVSKADAFMLTSRYEGLSISLLEAMGLGKVCFVTNVIGNNDIINGVNGVLFEKNIDFSLYNDKSVLQKIGFAAFECIKNGYTLEVFYKKIYQLYLDALNLKAKS